MHEARKRSKIICSLKYTVFSKISKIFLLLVIKVEEIFIIQRHDWKYVVQ